MNRREFLKSSLAAFAFPRLAAPLGADVLPPPRARRPNIILVLADDLGYGDVGWLFQNARGANARRILTPNLDRFAAEGLSLTGHYSAAPVCAPARASLLTGRTQGTCSLRDNMFDCPIQERATLATVLHSAGYATFAIGKWGIGGGGESGCPLTAHPLDRGFDHFYGFLDHRAGHTYYHFDDRRGGAYLGIHEDREVATAGAIGIYSTDLFAARAKKHIYEQTVLHPDQPFFMYLAFNTVHGSGRENPTLVDQSPFHVPGRPYPSGGGKAGGVQWPLAPEATRRRNTWLEPETRGWPTAMARYATSIRRLDRALGDILQLLKDLKIDGETLVVFSSDNGPADEYGADTRFFTSAGPFDGLKRDCFEGGMREPTFARWPGRIVPGGVCARPTAAYDWLPTFAELAGAPVPAVADGVSLVPTLLPAAGRPQPPSTVYCEYDGPRVHMADFREFAARKGGVKAVRAQQQMVRIGDYVAVRTAVKSADDPLRLYNVAVDPYQTKDLAGDPAEAGRLASMRRALSRLHRPLAAAPRPYDRAPVAALAEDERPADGGRVSSLAEVLAVVASPRPPAWLKPGQKTARVLMEVPETKEYTFTRAAPGAFARVHAAPLFLLDEPTAKIRLAAGIHPVTVSWA